MRGPLVRREEVKVMNKYETLFVITPSLTDEEVKAVIERTKTVIANGNGVVDNVDEWGKRKLAYEINKINEGYYVLINFTSDPELPKELDRVFRISDNVIRHLIVKL